MLRQAEADLARLETEALELAAELSEIEREFAAKRAKIEQLLMENEQKRSELATFIKLAPLYSQVVGPEPLTPAVSEATAAPHSHSGSAVTAPMPNQLLSRDGVQRSHGGRQPYGTMIRAVELCAQILKETGRPWTTRDLLTELGKRGLQVGGYDPLTNLSGRLGKSNLFRSNKMLGWHLQEWADFPDPSEERVATLRAQLEEARKAAATEGHKTNSISTDPPFYGKGMPELVVEVLKRHGSAMSNSEIASSLVKDGFVFVPNDHAAAVHSALRRRVTSVGDVVRVGVGIWGMVEWYTQEQLTEFAQYAERPRLRNVASPRALEATRAGVKGAKSRGVRFGRLPQYSQKDMDLARKMLVEGASISQVAKVFNMTPSGVNKWRKRWEVKNDE